MGKHVRGIFYLEPGAKPRHRFVIALGTIVLLAFGAMAIVAALYPENGATSANEQDRYTDPFGSAPVLPIDPNAQGAPLLAAYAVPSTSIWDNGFQAQVALTNTTPVAQPWQLRLRYPASVSGISSTWVDGQPQPIVEIGPDVFVFTGAAPVQPGQTVLFRVQFDRTPGSDFTLSECTANGKACATA